MKSDGNLRSYFRKHLPSVHWTSIETPMTEPGVPDMNGCVSGSEFWVENKLASGMRVSVRPGQIGWHLRRARCGGITFIAVRRISGKKIDDLYLYRGADIGDLSREGLSLEPLVHATGGPSKWNWETVLKALQCSDN